LRHRYATAPFNVSKHLIYRAKLDVDSILFPIRVEPTWLERVK
jgi:hypothetical protein